MVYKVLNLTKLKSMWFKNRKLIKISEGSHGNHWGAYYGNDTFKRELDTIIKETSISNIKKDHTIGRYNVRTIKRLEVISKIISDSYQDITFYPILKSSNKYNIEFSRIYEWKHAKGTEGQIECEVDGNYLLTFFATDFLENKEKYINASKLEVNFSGFAYYITKAEPV